MSAFNMRDNFIEVHAKKAEPWRIPYAELRHWRIFKGFAARIQGPDQAHLFYNNQNHRIQETHEHPLRKTQETIIKPAE